MNNPGIDLEIWEQLRKKWSDLDVSGHKVKVEFRLIVDPDDENKVLTIDVVQNIDDEPVIETVQRSAKEVYEVLNIADLSLERLVQVYKELMDNSQSQVGRYDDALIVTMSPTSPTSGELRGVLENQKSGGTSSVALNYRHYYLLNAIRDRVIELTGDTWRQVKAVYQSRGLEFYFEY